MQIARRPKTKHPVAGDLDVAGILARLDGLGWDNVLNAPVLLLSRRAILHGVGTSSDAWCQR